MANVIIDWGSISAKVGNKITAKAKRASSLKAKVLAKTFIDIMNQSIENSAWLTGPEKERVLANPLVCTGATVTGVHTNSELGVEYGIELFFDFSGDKKMISISPKKYVHNLVALFNNGYASNNVDPERPPKGMWHGQFLIIRPKSKAGARFVENAVDTFKSLFNNQDVTVNAKISPEYNGGV